VFRRKLPRSSLVFLCLAVAAGLLAALSMRGYARRLEATRPDVGPPREVVTASVTLTRGATLTADMVRAGTMPSAFVPPGAETDVGAVVGRVLSSDVAAGEVLTRSRLSGTEAGPVAAIVPEGLQAFVIASTLPADAVRPGDHVDVLAAFGGGRPHVETAAVGVEVGGVLAPAQGGGIAGGVEAIGQLGAPSLVLLVDPDTAERLAFAVAFAKLTVVVEPADSDGFFTSAGVGRG
jgi:Flp pilus assembly protein CpaB